MDTQREAWSKVFWGTVTSLVGVVGFVLIVVGGFAVADHSSRTTEVRTDWSGVWLHESDGMTSVFRLWEDGSLAALNVSEEIVGPGRDEVFNGCWDPETVHYPMEDSTVSIQLLGNGNFSHLSELSVENDDTLYLGEGLGRWDYQRYTGSLDAIELPEPQTDVESCEGIFWEDW